MSAPAAVVIPAYNEAATIRDVAQRALRQLPLVIVVDDGSDDGTAQQLEGLGTVVLRNTGNLGKAASLRRGAAEAIGMGEPLRQFLRRRCDRHRDRRQPIGLPCLPGARFRRGAAAL